MSIGVAPARMVRISPPRIRRRCSPMFSWNAEILTLRAISTLGFPVNSRSSRCQYRLVARLNQCFHVPFHAFELCALDGASAKQRREIGLGEAEEIRDRCVAILVPRLECWVPRWGVAVPGADLLTDVAAQGVRFETSGDEGVERSAMLDRGIADTAMRIERPVGKDGRGRAGVDAARAGAASIGGSPRRDVVLE